MPLMSTYMANAGLSDIMHILHTAGGACRTGTDIAARINTLHPEYNLQATTNQLIDLENRIDTIRTNIQQEIEKHP